jgi:hypothetical protein
LALQFSRAGSLWSHRYRRTLGEHLKASFCASVRVACHAWASSAGAFRRCHNHEKCERDQTRKNRNFSHVPKPSTRRIKQALGPVGVIGATEGV